MQKLQDQETQAGRNPELRSPGRREKLSPTERASPCGHIQTATAIPQVPPQRCPVTPGPPRFLPSLVVAERQAAKAMTMESEDVRSPCAHAMIRQGHRARDRATSVVPAPLRASAQSYGTRRLMQRHFAHIARIHTGERLGREGAACLSPLASQWGGWALQQAPLPAPHAHAVPSPSIHPDGGLPLPTAIHPPSLATLEQPPPLLALPNPLRFSCPAAARAKLAA